MIINSDDESRLLIWLAGVVSKAVISKWGVYTEDQSASPEISEKLKLAFEKHLDSGSLRQFLSEELFRDAISQGFIIKEENEEIALTDAIGGQDTLQVARRLVEKLRAIPRNYTLYVRGPRAMSEATKRRTIRINLSDQLSLVSSSLLKDQVSFDSGSKDLDQYVWESHNLAEKSLASNYLYFVYRTSGYLTGSSNSRLMQEFMADLRAFYGACLAHQVLSPYTWRSGMATVILGVEEGCKIIRCAASLESDLVQATYFGSRLKQHYKKDETFTKTLEPVREFFDCNSPRLRTAAMWLLRAKVSQRPLDRVLESAITLEVLLGDQKMADRVGLTKLMGNRCAYALAETHSERENLISFFGEFYRLRSEIVHAGRFVHSSNDTQIVQRGLQLASEMLVYEQRLSACSRH